MTSSPGRRRAAVVGTGAIVSGGHLPALRAHTDRVELVAAVDVDPGRLDAFRTEAGEGVTGFSTTEAMLAAVRPDLVLIGTPPSLHREQTVAALKAGAWVLCEKPLCLSLAEYDEIAAAEAASGAYASVIFQHRYGSGAVRARELIRGGELGAPLVAHCQTTWHRDAGYYSVPWRGRWATEGGGPTTGHGAGYTGLQWRGPRDFTGGTVFAPGVEGGGPGERFMGTQGPWLGFTAERDAVDGASTVVFAHAPENLDAGGGGRAVHPSHWFVRSEPIPSVAFSWAFFEEFGLPAGESFACRYRVVVADGAWDRERVEEFLAGVPW
ncbi:DUF6807 family protein [Streptomyces sp. enrichment culture]|uniref:DUF6807 family protein n=1 Tax=Streptomyces sp. enrichment culture TaxID=1795815 RepID=UPI003F577C1B